MSGANRKVVAMETDRKDLLDVVYDCLLDIEGQPQAEREKIAREFHEFLTSRDECRKDENIDVCTTGIATYETPMYVQAIHWEPDKRGMVEELEELLARCNGKTSHIISDKREDCSKWSALCCRKAGYCLCSPAGTVEIFIHGLNRYQHLYLHPGDWLVFGWESFEPFWTESDESFRQDYVLAE